jgi:hypothetical protein
MMVAGEHDGDGEQDTNQRVSRQTKIYRNKYNLPFIFLTFSSPAMLYN